MIHLFHVNSNFQLLVVDFIINCKGIALDDVFFITSRRLELPSPYDKRLLYDNSNNDLLERLMYYRKNRKTIGTLLRDNSVCAYFPFSHFFPTYPLYDEYAFFEEGFSAYGTVKYTTHKADITREFLKKVVVDLLLPFEKKNIKGFVSGVSRSSSMPIRSTFYRISKDAYGIYNNETNLQFITLKIDHLNNSFSNTIHDANILVLDRLSSAGRPYEKDNYLSCLAEMLGEYLDKSDRIFIKFHPADYDSPHARSEVEEALSEFHLETINDNLEWLALSNSRNTFWGFNSTTLYYAPIFGNTNKSFSFVRKLAGVDSKYADFLMQWGGTEKFCEIFGKQVKCL